MRYYNLNTYNLNKYGQKVGKLALDGAMTCPNRDGKLSYDGCIFCSEKGSGDFTFSKLSIKDQISKQKKVAKNKWKVNKFIAYFQSFTNTYGDISYLDSLYRVVISDKDIIGLSIATRADCLDVDVLDLLIKYKSLTNLTLEIGMQSIHEKTINYINRSYSHAYLDKKLKILKKYDIDFLLHIIVGLPGESEEDIYETIRYINHIKPYAIKIHSLYIQNDAPIYKDYLEKKIPYLSKDKYTSIVAQIISKLDPNIVIERLTGDGDRNKLVSPLWSKDKLSVISQINKKLKELDLRQGSAMII